MRTFSFAGTGSPTAPSPRSRSPDGTRLYAIDGAVFRVDASTGGGLIEVASLARPVAIDGVDAR